MSDTLQEIRNQLPKDRRALLRRLEEVEKQIREIPEADTAYRNDLNLLYKERDIIYEMLAELAGVKSSQNSVGTSDHEAQLVARMEKQQAERAAKLAELTDKIDAFKSKIQSRSRLKAVLKKIGNFMTPQGSRVPAPEYGK